MRESKKRIVLTGFMGVGKSTVARHLARLTRNRHVDLDDLIETSESRSVVTIIEEDGVDYFRGIETQRLREVLAERRFPIVSLGGGTWTIERNRDLIRDSGYVTVWLETTFEHCWRNIRASRKRRPLVGNRDQTRRLFEEREKLYCLADWHFVIGSGYNSFDIARQISEEVFFSEADGGAVGRNVR
jgi:shikimate kinase